MVNKEELIRHCRYYRGEKENPDENIPDMA